MANTRAEAAYVDRGDARPTGSWIGMRRALNPDIPECELRALAYCDVVMVRRGVAYNPATPTDVLHDLARDANPRVREAAEFSLKTRLSARGA